MDVNKALNALIAALLPVVNSQLPSYLKEAGLDPWEGVKGDKTLGKINLGVCTAKVEASYAIKNVTGLSTLDITTLTIDTVVPSGPKAVNGTMTMFAKLNSDLSAKVSGKVSAKCGALSESAGISGKVTAGGVTGKGQVKFAASLDEPKICLDSLDITSLGLDYEKIKVEIDGLGVLNEFLAPLVAAIDELFGNTIKHEIAGIVRDELNKLLKGELPFCITYNG
jgi:hypothetical protein